MLAKHSDGFVRKREYLSRKAPWCSANIMNHIPYHISYNKFAQPLMFEKDGGRQHVPSYFIGGFVSSLRWGFLIVPCYPHITLHISLLHPQTGVGTTKPDSSDPLFSHFFTLSKHWLSIEYHVHIWQVSLQLSCGDTHQIWKWLKEPSRYYCIIKIALTVKLTNLALVAPTSAKLAITKHLIVCYHVSAYSH